MTDQSPHPARRGNSGSMRRRSFTSPAIALTLSPARRVNSGRAGAPNATQHPARRGNSGSRPAAMSPTPGPPGQQREAQTHPARRGNSGRETRPQPERHTTPGPPGQQRETDACGVRTRCATELAQHPARRGNSGRAGAPNATPGPPGQQREKPKGEGAPQ